MKNFPLNKNDRERVVHAIMNDVPAVDYHTEASKLAQGYAYNRMPAKVQAVYNDTNTRHYLNTERVWSGSDAGSTYAIYVARSGESSLSREEIAAVELVMKNGKAQIAKRNLLRAELLAELGRVRTYDSLVAWAGDRYAEYIKVVQPREVVKNLPATGDLYLKLQSLGFPKGSEPAQVADTKQARRVRKATAKEASK